MRGWLTVDEVLTGRAAVARRWFEAPVLGAAFLVIPVVFIEEYSTTGWLLTVAGIANWLIWAVFAAEFGMVVSLADNRVGYARRAGLDLLVIVVSFPLLPELFALSRLVRLARLSRVLRTLRVFPILVRGLCALGGCSRSGVLGTCRLYSSGLLLGREACLRCSRVTRWLMVCGGRS